MFKLITPVSSEDTTTPWWILCKIVNWRVTNQNDEGLTVLNTIYGTKINLKCNKNRGCNCNHFYHWKSIGSSGI